MHLPSVLLAAALLAPAFGQEEGATPEPVDSTPPAEEAGLAEPADDFGTPVPVEEASADTAAMDNRQRVSYLFGFTRIGPAVPQMQIDVDAMALGLMCAVEDTDPAVKMDEAQQVFQDYEAILAGGEAAPVGAGEMSLQEKASYLFGMIQLARPVTELGLDPASCISGIRDSAANVAAKVPVESFEAEIKAYEPELQRLQEEREAELLVQGAENAKAAAEYMAEIATKEGVSVTASGLAYEVITPAEGPKAVATDTVRVYYTGRLMDGTVFDSCEPPTEPISFGLNEVIPAWTEGVQLISVGARYRLHVPPELGYGARGTGSIPPNAVLVFEVELVGIE